MSINRSVTAALRAVLVVLACVLAGLSASPAVADPVSIIGVTPSCTGFTVTIAGLDVTAENPTPNALSVSIQSGPATTYVFGTSFTQTFTFPSLPGQFKLFLFVAGKQVEEFGGSQNACAGTSTTTATTTQATEPSVTTTPATEPSVTTTPATEPSVTTTATTPANTGTATTPMPTTATTSVPTTPPSTSASSTPPVTEPTTSGPASTVAPTFVLNLPPVTGASLQQPASSFVATATELPRTGTSTSAIVLWGCVLAGVGCAATVVARRRPS